MKSVAKLRMNKNGNEDVLFESADEDFAIKTEKMFE